MFLCDNSFFVVSPEYFHIWGFFIFFSSKFQLFLKIFFLVFTRVSAYFISFYEKTLEKVLAIQIKGVILLYQITTKTKKHDNNNNKKH